MITFRKIKRPEKSEYPPYSQYYFDLIKTEDDILQELYDNFFKLKELVFSLTPEQLSYRYESSKWTIKEILLHLIDDERIFSYRALRYARNDSTPLPGFDQDRYTHYTNANSRSIENIIEEYWSVRHSTLQLFQNLPEDCFLRKGSIIDSDGTVNNERTVRALVYHIAGHELRHIQIIKERYLV